MELFLMICIPAFFAGIVQGITGFGAGIVMMMVFPFMFNVTQAAGLSSAIGTSLCFLMVLRYRRHVEIKSIIAPAILFMIVSSLTIHYSTMVNEYVMRLLFGVFLTFLAIYFLFFSNNKVLEIKLPLAILFILLSGIFSGLFGIGGPLMVIYFLSKLDTKEKYLGTIQTFFLIIAGYSTFFRFQTGIIGGEHLPFIFLGMIGVLAGVNIAHKMVERIDGETIKKLTYLLIGFSGIYNVINCVF